MGSVHQFPAKRNQGSAGPATGSIPDLYVKGLDKTPRVR
jgi:hypothetical protein